MNSGQSLWSRAKSLIPGGNMLLSKRAELFLPGSWPTYFNRAKGCEVWDLDGIHYFDFAQMSVGACSLGYSNERIDNTVKDVIGRGIMSTLNCPEEVQLAEQLVSLHQWSDMVRFARSGGEANAIAIRIARAATGRDAVAICGYHGWHDWYLSANLSDADGLSEHLLPGLDAKGVPRSLTGTVFPFVYNDLETITDLITNNNLAAVKMEVQRSCPPDPGFLQSIRELCTQNGVVLIFDECTSGFRQCFGGLHKVYNVNPDLAMFGKALGNGYAITAIIGKESVMQAAQSTFISSTFWTERIGPVAAIATLDLMQEMKSWEIITSLGAYLSNCWHQLSVQHDLNITISGIPSLTGFVFNSPHHLHLKTLMTQEMLKKGFLATTSCYISTAHSIDIIDCYIDALSEVFNLLSSCHDDLVRLDSLLAGEVCHSGFTRLN